eukprot:1195595-Prorocentrum_minimum.AAC.3
MHILQYLARARLGAVEKVPPGRQLVLRPHRGGDNWQLRERPELRLVGERVPDLTRSPTARSSTSAKEDQLANEKVTRGGCTANRDASGCAGRNSPLASCAHRTAPSRIR